ncbi:MAG TPA: hypothetical protein VFE15_07675 [Marmoricola sp.]|jgi:hypothetical protein|nr:hypothetical protein [Marmoricola sp.]
MIKAAPFNVVHLVAVGAVAAVVLTGCGSSGNRASSNGSSGNSSSGTDHTASGSGSTTPDSNSTAGSSGDQNAAGMTFAGAFSGSIEATLCTGAIASIEVTVKGDAEKYRGSISATSFGFVGPEAADYSLMEGSAKPTVSADGSTFTVDDATLVDLISKKSVDVSGSVTCP